MNRGAPRRARQARMQQCGAGSSRLRFYFRSARTTCERRGRTRPKRRLTRVDHAVNFLPESSVQQKRSIRQSPPPSGVQSHLAELNRTPVPISRGRLLAAFFTFLFLRHNTGCQASSIRSSIECGRCGQKHIAIGLAVALGASRHSRGPRAQLWGPRHSPGHRTRSGSQMSSGG